MQQFLKYYDRGKPRYVEKTPVPVPPHPPQIPQEPAWATTRAAAVRGGRLTAWAHGHVQNQGPHFRHGLHAGGVVNFILRQLHCRGKRPISTAWEAELSPQPGRTTSLPLPETEPRLSIPQLLSPTNPGLCRTLQFTNVYETPCTSRQKHVHHYLCRISKKDHALWRFVTPSGNNKKMW
jgi:hypothetical protein